ncbi:MAG: RagB/SusD family nutrient uptake outer membrane protein [Bacteroidales bacterium]|nr:RagB/SusD family nutrient uptake outer membrane protein [Bacteroidales bacterium]MBD5281892.1 RagB/SusD family nutrient uptake outer membrane protein [Bacteroides sp.]MDE6032631.1 RagB/SusD family nutrient uptake outer membrane protein [Muribaculaceae bacterium]MBD5352856.1 RagB/SusD family nutrient uptake outer membrane protein [Bacteroides sp.]MBD5359887.1 RagB/SusD family nutrient uptake outer membrane protein [Bacteroides sp.]
MKVKNIFKYASLALAMGTLAGVTSCNYLDVVPPEQPGLSDAMKNHSNAQGFLYSCYNGVSQRDFSPRDYRSGLNAANDEFLIPETWMAVDGPTSYAIMRNTLQTTATNYDPKFWDSYYSAIGQTLLFERELLSEGRKNSVCEDPNEEELWLAESRFCRAFYHYQVLRIYGPVPITDKFIAMDTDPSNYPGRVHVDGVVDWIANELEECAKVFERQEMQTRSHEYQGRATSVICYALQARLYLMAASDLWNGKFPYKTWRNKTNSKNPITGEDYGNKLFSDTYESWKWERALAACIRAYHKAQLAGYRLYTIEDAAHMDADDVLADAIYIPGEENMTAPANMPEWSKEDFKETVRMLRYLNTTTPHEGNKEIIWSNQQVVYGMTDSRLPRRVLETTETNSKWKEGWNGVSPTLYTVEHFLNANGLTPGHDSSMPKASWYQLAGFTGDRANVMNICVNREPRFYAWIAFDGGDYLTLLNDGDPKLLNMQNAEMQGRGQGERNYSVTGFLSMKHVDPLSKWAANNGQWTSGKNSPDVLIRMAEVMLNLAECFAEMEDRGIAIPTGDYDLFPNVTYTADDMTPSGAEAHEPDGGKVNILNFMAEADLGSNAKEAAMNLVNQIRSRAYVAPLTESMIGMVDDARNTSRSKVWTLTEWVRNERFVELWDEGVRYFDVRRWVAGDEYFAYGMREGLNGLKVKPTSDEWHTPIMINSQYTFHKRQYLWPLYQSEVYNNPQMVQAPGY